ncbi:hypothetical protein AAHE18_19G066400 [Arachis hypogaea]
MRIISWNCRGLGNPWTVRALSKLIRQKGPNLVFLMETRRKETEMMRMRYKGGLANVVAVDCEGEGRQRAGGLAVLWDNSIRVLIRSMSINHIDMEVEMMETEQRWRATGFYGWPKLLGRESNMPGMIFGDFNQVMGQHEKQGRNSVIQTNELLDLGFVGHSFAWTNGQVREDNIQERLDRAMETMEWKEAYPKTMVQHLNRYKSYHSPILVDMMGEQRRRRKAPHRFRFEECWLGNEECEKVVKEAWDSSEGTIETKIKNCGSRLDKWGETNFGDIPKRIRTLQNKLQHLNTLKQEEGILLQIKKASQRKKRNWVKSIKDDMGVSFEDEKMEEVMVEYFDKLFMSEGGEGIHEAADIVKGKIDSGKRELLDQEFTAEEVLQALKQMHPTKSPGPDGMPALFYQKMWKTVGNDVTYQVFRILNHNDDPAPINATYIYFRPISLCNVIFKLVTKTIANRLKQILPDIVGEFQNNGLVAFEIFHYMKKKTTDMAKAYDRIEWPFLKEVMVSMGFSSRWVNLIWNCISSIKNFKPSRGLRQGDPLSPYLFAQNSKIIRGIKVARQAPQINHLFFDIQGIKEWLGIKAVEQHSKYLGLPTFVERSKKEKKLKGWKERYLSRVGKETLIKAVAQSIPTYIMGYFQLPKSLCQHIDKGERKIHWIKWDKLCTSKMEGGLGFRNFEAFNSALLAKQGWRLMRKPTSLAARLIKARYYPRTNFLESSIGYTPSYTWRSIWNAKEVLQIGGIWKLEMADLFKIWSPVKFLGKEAIVRELMNDEGSSSDARKIKDTFMEFETQQILQISLPITTQSDKFYWRFTRNGEFKKRLCKAKAHPRAINCVWRLMNNSLPTRLNLQKRGVNCTALCPRCWKKEETETHLIKDSIRSSEPPGAQACEWIEELMKNLNSVSQGLLCTSILIFWQARNKHMFNEENQSPIEAAELTRKNHENYIKAQTVNLNGTVESPPGATSTKNWKRPPITKVKINVDAASIDDGVVGVGVVVRDTNGDILMASTCKAFLSIQFHEAEALACLMGLEKACECCFFDAIIENDNVEVIQSLKEKEIHKNCFANSLRSVEYSHVKRNGNRIAHELAQIVLINLNTVWIENALFCIYNLAYLNIIGPIHE